MVESVGAPQSARGRQMLVKCAVLTVIALLLIGAFLAWGPIGLGNGPLDLGNSAGFVDGYLGRAPVGLMVGLSNSGDASAVINTVEVIGAPGYRGPRLLALHAANDIAH